MDKRELIKELIYKIFHILNKKRLNKKKKPEQTPIRVYDEIMYVPTTNNGRVFYSAHKGDVVVASLALIFQKDEETRAYTLGFFLSDILIIPRRSQTTPLYSPSREITLDEYLFGIDAQHLADVLVEFFEERLTEEIAVTRRGEEYWMITITDIRVSTEELLMILVDALLYRNPRREVILQVLRNYFLPTLSAGELLGDKTFAKFCESAMLPLSKEEIRWLWEHFMEMAVANLETYLRLYAQEILARALKYHVPPKFPSTKQLSHHTGYSGSIIDPIWRRIKKQILAEYKERIFLLAQPIAFRLIQQDPFISYREFKALLKTMGLRNQDIQTLWYNLKEIRKSRQVEEWIAIASEKLRPVIADMLMQGIKPTKKALLREIKLQGLDVLAVNTMKKALDIVLAQYEITPARKEYAKELVNTYLRARVLNAISEIAPQYFKIFKVPNKREMYTLVKKALPQATRDIVYHVYSYYLRAKFKTDNINEIKASMREKYYTVLVKQLLKSIPKKERKGISARKLYRLARERGYKINKEAFFKAFKSIRRR